MQRSDLFTIKNISMVGSVSLVKTLNTGSMEQMGKELRIIIMFMLMEMSLSQVSTKGE